MDTKTAEEERMGFFHGERKEAVERIAEQTLKAMEKENLSVTQAEYLVSVLARKIKEKKSTLLANTKIE